MTALTAGHLLARAAGRVADMVEEARHGVARVSGLAGSLRPLILSEAALKTGRVVVVGSDDLSLAPLREDLQGLLGELAPAASLTAPALMTFPALEADPYQGIGAHPQVLAERAATLTRMLQLKRWVVLVPYTALLAPLLPVARYRELFFRLERGREFPFEALSERLAAAGFKRVDMASSPGEWARRGGIFDLFPPGGRGPVRIEMEEDRVVSLRLFDPLSQRSLEEIQAAEITPALEAPLCQAGRRELLLKLERMPRTGDVEAGSQQLEELAVEGTFQGLETCAGLWAGRETDLLDYAGDCLLVLDEPFRIEAEKGRLLTDLAASQAASKSVLPPPRRLLLPEERLTERLQRPRLELHDLGVQEGQAGKGTDGLHLDLGGRAPRVYFGKLQTLAGDLEAAAGASRHTLLMLETEGLLERTRELLHERGLDPAMLPATVPPGGEPPRLALSRGRLRHGFELPDLGLTVLTEEEIFGRKRGKAPRGGRRAAPFRWDFRSLAVGDIVVHIDHGLGRYQGTRQLDPRPGQPEFMVLVYRDGAVLYVPMDRLDLVQRYSGAGGGPPRLDRLGAPGWEKSRRRIKKEMQDLADDLLNLYAARRALPGRAFGPDGSWQVEFEAAFPFQETPDQETAVQDVKHDMESSVPMDRLLCGDVGFGKTEVAMRAIFKAVMEGAQAALLAPTTILAFQHFNTFRARFAPFPVAVEMLSRFQDRQKQKEIIKGVKDGTVDIVVGTHRLLSRDVAFKDLGILVVDEEQRFGVAHKERLKQFRSQVDVLTLTATPIPRTLQMSLAGVRDLSVLETPPENRLSIQTLLLPFRSGIIAQAIRREIRRGGQVFFVHNRVGSIAAMARLIRQEVPEVTLEVAHGQMDEGRLEKTMLRFMGGDFQVLLSTSIIENGLDIPRANTIIVNRADRFGLSQLYQLRGRVGRSDWRAYAYLLIPSLKDLKEEARRRLKALQEFTELGSGFRVAARDLEIRGAGEMLGGKQHGHIAALGFDLYCRMLEDAVREKRGEAPPVPELRVSLDLGVDFQLPADFVADAHQRLVLYKRVAAAAEDGRLQQVREELEDRYGHLPREAENLLNLAALRSQAERLGIATIEASGERVGLHFVDGAPLDPGSLLNWVRLRPQTTLAPSGLLQVPVSEDPDQRLREVVEIVGDLCGLVPAASPAS